MTKNNYRNYVPRYHRRQCRVALDARAVVRHGHVRRVLYWNALARMPRVRLMELDHHERLRWYAATWPLFIFLT